VVDVCAAVAAAKGLSFEQVASATTANSRRFFGL
jgi:Tat protein secretion system quality control protein TatD with DNase activity